MRFLSRAIQSAVGRRSISRIPTNAMARTPRFSDVAISGTKPSYFDFSGFSQMDGSSVTSKLPSNIDIRPMMTLQPSAHTLSKIAIKTIISAFLTILIGIAFETSVKSGVKKITTEIDKFTNEITDSVYKYIITTASEMMQKGDTAIIASIYLKVGRHLSIEKRKELLEKLVIDGVSYGWLAPYDSIVEQWLNKIIEIKGGHLPSDRFIINIVSIIRNKVIPLTNGIWYFKRAVKLRTGIGITDADIAPDEYWYTPEGRAATANATRDILAEDTVLANIIVGLLSANEAIDNANMLFDHVFSDINSMLRNLMITFKTHLTHAKSDKLSIVDERTLHAEPFNSEPITTTEISKLNESIKKCESFLDPSRNTSSNLFKRPRKITHVSRTTAFQKGNDRIHKLQQKFGIFDPTLGGGKKTRSARSDRSRSHNRSRSRSRNAMRRTRRVQHI